MGVLGARVRLVPASGGVIGTLGANTSRPSYDFSLTNLTSQRTICTTFHVYFSLATVMRPAVSSLRVRKYSRLVLLSCIKLSCGTP